MDIETAMPACLSDTPEAVCVKQFSRRQFLKIGSWSVLGAVGADTAYRWVQHVPPLTFDGRHAFASPHHPPIIHYIVGVANQLVDKPYKLGGGHRMLYDNGYDCSGSISHILYRSRLLDAPRNSQRFIDYGHPGPGVYVNVFVRPGKHVFMSVCGLRFDTTGGREGEGPRWRPEPRGFKEFVCRHPKGL